MSFARRAAALVLAGLVLAVPLTGHAATTIASGTIATTNGGYPLSAEMVQFYAGNCASSVEDGISQAFIKIAPQHRGKTFQLIAGGSATGTFASLTIAFNSSCDPTKVRELQYAGTARDGENLVEPIPGNAVYAVLWNGQGGSLQQQYTLKVL